MAFKEILEINEISKLKELLVNDFVIKNLYQHFRIINPETKKVIYIDKDLNINDTEIDCFSFMKKEHICENCLINRCRNAKSAYTRITNIGNKTYIITAIPYFGTLIELIGEITGKVDFDIKELGCFELKEFIKEDTFDKNQISMYVEENTQNNQEIVIDDVPPNT